MSGNQDFAALKKLLISWNVEILYELFKEEDISIDELKWIKFHHISFLLKNYKMGVKIRFEYYLENWRNVIGKPMQGEEDPNHIMCYCKSTREKSYINRTTRKPQEIPIDNLEPELAEPPAPPRSSQTFKSDSFYQEVLTMCVKSPVLTLSELQQNQKNSEHEKTVNEVITTKTDLQRYKPENSYTDNTPPMWPPKNNPELNVTLAQILQLCGKPGMSLIKYYEENNCLTNPHRAQLIHLIVDFFYDNDYHMSLKKSHDLECQILKMFPTEKIEHYRSRSRGKIYVKFCNIKQYKRDKKSNKNGKETPSNRAFRFTESASDYNMDTASFDSWPIGVEDEIEVKPEILSEDEFT